MPPSCRVAFEGGSRHQSNRRGIFPQYQAKFRAGMWIAGSPRMAPYVEHIVDRLRDAELDLTREARAFRQSVPAFIRESSVAALVTTPVIYSVLPVFLVLDAWITVYQWICFPVYGIARVARRRYFVIDRHKLAYLNGIEKVNCVYCGYANGLIAYVREIAARTEQYWCPIKHARPIPAPHARYRVFFEYGDARAYRQELPKVRRMLRSRRRKHARP
jgi:hypothetical protein